LKAPAATIRHAAIADLESLAGLAASTFRDTYRAIDDPDEIDDYVSTHFTVAQIGAFLRDPSSTLLVVRAAEEFTGYAHLKKSVAPTCVQGPAPIELARFYLRQDAMGRGYGAALLSAVRAEATKLDCATIWLGVDARNHRAREFFRRWGFGEVGAQTFVFGGRSHADPVLSGPVSYVP